MQALYSGDSTTTQFHSTRVQKNFSPDSNSWQQAEWLYLLLKHTMDRKDAPVAE
ncbi:hypothetical protein DPMN_099156 [Dreissena polymorpha]|uniref:Uncharacterized protein n=1 Tax=Dreissena polymorpha TaxID=45954 RepID=A0A9D4LDJ2_DREPO|nr:hypothetical protein DPMN_099156 [Dreissena polymorpha]